ncbi:choice-of-anchor J domain-containing protein [Leyella stercorea]|uniref:choice-of-anchor J domain-containing protein n=1 Tax=Leyella stercorea TaxID=363265 RepID=UPI002432F1C6|nr:choice-of-anchor J domain-containing protein [Leyella stercorea]
MGLLLALFGATNASAQSTVELPYSISFNSTNDVWTNIDASGNSGTPWFFNADWGSDGFCPPGSWTAIPSYCMKTSVSGANAYYVSPAFDLKKDKTYTVKVNTGRMYFTKAKLSLEYGKSATDASAFTTVSDIQMPETNVQYDNSYDVNVTEDGAYYFAFHGVGTFASSSNEYVYAFSFDIAEKTGGETPDPVDPPAVDQDGTLPYDMTFDSAEKFATWTTLDNSDTPGVTWAYTASDFAGKPAAHMGVDAKSGTCDWLVSPKFELKEGKSYTITMDAASGEGNTMDLMLDYFVGGKEIGKQLSIDYIGSKLPAKVGESGEVKNKWILNVTKDDVYQIAFRALGHTPNTTTDAISIYSVQIVENAEGEPDAPAALPYATSFAEEKGAEGWTAMDRSGNVSSTWSWNSWGYQEYGSDWSPVGDQHPCVGFSSDWGTNANDYWISPLFKLEPGKTYVAKAHTAVNRTCLEAATTSLTMKLGTNKKVQGSFDKTLGIFELNTVYDRDPSTFEFTVENAGNYYVAFHISDATGENAYGYIFDFSLAEKGSGEPEVTVATEAATGFAAAELTAEKSVELTWTNPTKDVDGKDLPADALLTVKVYEGEEVVKVFEDQAPGSEGKHVQVYTDETFAGEHNYKVVVVYKDKESEAATTSITVKVVVDAINGVMVPADAKVSVHTLSGVAVGNNLSTLGKGTYIVRVKTADGAVKTMKIAK